MKPPALRALPLVALLTAILVAGCSATRSTRSSTQAVLDACLASANTTLDPLPAEMPVPEGGPSALSRNLFPPPVPSWERYRGKKQEVVVFAVIDETGTVVEAYPYAPGRPDFDQAAVKAVRKTRFVPGRVGDTPVRAEVCSVLTMRY